MAPNPLDFLKVIQGLQRNMGDMEEKLRAIRVTGSAGGDMVEVVLNGHMEVVHLRVAAEVIDPQEREMLEDLIRAAFTDAVGKVKEHLRGEFSSVLGGMPLPPGLLGA
jgi:DNA-binding YbaB/EbfC family protein